jgi:hypothetical protein
MELPKVKNFEITVARKPDLIGPNQVYSFSSFIRLYLARIVSAVLLSMSFNLLDRAINIAFESHLWTKSKFRL